MLPLQEVTRNESDEYGTVFYSALSKINPAALQPLSPQKKRLFQAALKVLDSDVLEYEVDEEAKLPATGSGNDDVVQPADGSSAHQSLEDNQWPALMLLGCGRIPG